MNEGLLTKKEKRIEKNIWYSKTFSNTKDGPISS